MHVCMPCAHVLRCFWFFPFFLLLQIRLVYCSSVELWRRGSWSGAVVCCGGIAHKSRPLMRGVSVSLTIFAPIPLSFGWSLALCFITFFSAFGWFCCVASHTGCGMACCLLHHIWSMRLHSMAGLTRTHSNNIMLPWSHMRDRKNDTTTTTTYYKMTDDRDRQPSELARCSKMNAPNPFFFSFLRNDFSRLGPVWPQGRNKVDRGIYGVCKSQIDAILPYTQHTHTLHILTYRAVCRHRASFSFFLSLFCCCFFFT